MSEIEVLQERLKGIKYLTEQSEKECENLKEELKNANLQIMGLRQKLRQQNNNWFEEKCEELACDPDTYEN